MCISWIPGAYEDYRVLPPLHDCNGLALDYGRSLGIGLSFEKKHQADGFLTRAGILHLLKICYSAAAGGIQDSVHKVSDNKKD